MNIPYRDLRVKDEGLRQKLLQAVEKVLSSGRIMFGPEVEEFEKKMADLCCKKHAVGLGSGTMAIYLTLRGLDIGPGDEVITTPLSWIATLNAITLTGAQPVFADVDMDFNINPGRIEEAVTSKTKCIVPVHLMGKVCDMEQILKIAEKHNLYVVEDAAQAFGARMNDAPAGSFGHAGCFSMNPMKIFCAYGEAGIVVTDDDKLCEKLKTLRYLGTLNRGDCQYPSFNGKIDTIHAAMLLINLKYLDKRIERGREIAGYYNKELKDIVTCPQGDGPEHVYLSYAILTPERNELAEFLQSKGIEAKIQYPVLMPNHSAYRKKYAFHAPVGQCLADQMLSLPNQDYMSMEDASFVISNVKNFFSR